MTKAIVLEVQATKIAPASFFTFLGKKDIAIHAGCCAQ